MDPLTHAVSGVALARALPRAPLPRRQMLWLAALAMLPDADIVLSWFSDAAYLRYHRGVTHSLLMLPLWTWLIHALLRKRKSALPPWLIAAAIGLHIGLDVITSFGTMILAPLSDWRAALDWVFIIDPAFTACWLLPLLAGLAMPRHARRAAQSSLALAGAWLLLTLAAHQAALDTARSHAPNAAVAALPLPFSPLHWQLIVDRGDHFERAMLDLAPGWPDAGALFPARFRARFIPARPADDLHWQRFARLQAGASAPAGLGFYLWFARFPVILDKQNGVTAAGDLRFGIERDARRWPFRLRLEENQAWLIWRNGRTSPLGPVHTDLDGGDFGHDFDLARQRARGVPAAAREQAITPRGGIMAKSLRAAPEMFPKGVHSALLGLRMEPPCAAPRALIGRISGSSDTVQISANRP